MRLKHWGYIAGILIAGSLYACKEKPKKSSRPVTYKGMYSFGPEGKSFKDCSQGREFWVVDSSAQLELQYSQLHLEQQYVPVYIEVVGEKILSPKDDISAVFDSTLVVKKLIRITKEIPKSCN